MRRFVEEIHVRDPKIANTIAAHLELATDDKGNSYEVEMYERNREFDITRNKPDEFSFIALKIFVKGIPVI